MYDLNAILGSAPNQMVPLDQMQGLKKAMTTGSGIPTPGAAVPGNFAPLVPESLEQYLYNAIETSDDLVMLKAIAPFKERVGSPTSQWDTLEGVGRSASIFLGEIGRPNEEDSTYVRRTIETKVMGVVGRVSLRTQSANTIAGVGDAMAAEVSNRTLFLLRNIEQAIFVGDSSLIPDQFDGLERQIAAANPENIFDARGALLTLNLVNRVASAARAAGNFGRLNTMFCSVRAYSGILDDVLNTATVNRQNFDMGAGDTTYGVSVRRFMSAFGEIDVTYSQFIVEGTAPEAFGPIALRPSAPLAGGAVAAAANPASLFVAADAGDYIYAVAALSARGQSAALQTVAVTVAAGDGVTIPVVDGGNGTTCYVVYRSTKNGGVDTLREAFRVARTGAAQNIVDVNTALPGTSKAYLLTVDADALAWSELTPLQKLDMARTDSSSQFMLYTDAALKVRTARKHAVIINLGIPDGALAAASAGSFIPV